MRISLSVMVCMALASGAFAQTASSVSTVTTPADAPAAAAPVAMPPVTVTAPADAPPPRTVRIVCIRGQADTGSHLGAKKICHTEEEWAMIHEQSDRTMERYREIQNQQLQTQASGGTLSPNGH